MNFQKKSKGITLIALVVTIIILLILTGVVLKIVSSQGILSKAENAANETEKQTATEKINFKITSKQIDSYSENNRMPTLKELALFLDEDDEIQYVYKESKATASLDWWGENDEFSSIFTKLSEYPYEFEIDSSLRLASVDGVKIADSSPSITEEQINAMIDAKLSELETKYATKSNLEEMNAKIQENAEKIMQTQTDIENIQKSALTVDTIYTGKATVGESYTITKDISDYKYLVIYCAGTTSVRNQHCKTTRLISVSDIVYNDATSAISNSSYYCQASTPTGDMGYGMQFWFRNSKSFYIATCSVSGGFSEGYIYKIEGIK